MKKILLSIALAAVSAMPVLADVTASEAFTSAPQTVFPLLDKNTRLDMVDYFSNGMATPSQNALEGRSAITELTPQSLTVKMTDSSAAQIVVLNGEGRQIIALINTVAAPGLDSKISFYDADWQPMSADKIFTKPGWAQWLNAEGRQNEEDVTMQVPFMLSSYRIDPATSTLTLTNNLSHFLDKDIYESISGYLNPALTYVWTGKKYALK